MECGSVQCVWRKSWCCRYEVRLPQSHSGIQRNGRSHSLRRATALDRSFQSYDGVGLRMGHRRRRKSDRVSAELPDTHHDAACEGLQTVGDSAIEYEPARPRTTWTRE